MPKLPSFSRRDLALISPERQARKGVAFIFFGLTVPWFFWLMIQVDETITRGFGVPSEDFQQIWRQIALWMGVVRALALVLALVGIWQLKKSEILGEGKKPMVLQIALTIDFLGQLSHVISSFSNMSLGPLALFRVFGLVSLVALVTFALHCGQIVARMKGVDFPNLASGVIGLLIFRHFTSWVGYALPWQNARLSMMVMLTVSMTILVMFALLFLRTWRALSLAPDLEDGEPDGVGP